MEKLYTALAGQFNFDQFGRYAMIARIVEANRKQAKLRILDVGGYAGHLRDFLPNDDITILDVFEVTEPGYVKGDALNMDFKDGEFDVVTSADVLEHIPADQRERFLSESYRVSKDFLIVAAPFDEPGVHEAEVRANEIYKKYAGEDYIWLKEHIANGLPDPKQVESWIESNQLKSYLIRNNALDEWEAFITAFFVLDAHRSPKGERYFRKLNNKFNLVRNVSAAKSPAYRNIYAISKSALGVPNFPGKEKLPVSKPDPDKILGFYNELLSTPATPRPSYSVAKTTVGIETPYSVFEQQLLDEVWRRGNIIEQKEAELSSVRNSFAYRTGQLLSRIPLVKTCARLTKKVLARRRYLIASNLIWRHQTKLSLALKDIFVGIDLTKNRKDTEASIIIPVFNKAEYTLQCLASLANHNSRHGFEVVVIDNASSDATERLLPKIPGLNYHRNQTNDGFVDACNQGAKLAKGKFLVMLNNDTQVQDGWLDGLLDVFDQDQKAGIVGSKLVYPNGTLQEAGGIIFSDGNGWNYGRGDNPNAFPYSYRKEVDYCSGASIAIPKTLFDELGGFDRRYAPAYYEDTDLAFAVRKAGFKVIYEPTSVVTHFEGITAGTDLSQGFKKYQAINREKFIDKWHEELKDQWPSEQYLLQARQRGPSKKVLILDQVVPNPSNDSGAVRMTAIIKILQRMGYSVTFWPTFLKAPQVSSPALRNKGVEVVDGMLKFKDFAAQRENFYDVIVLCRAPVAAEYIDDCMTYFPSATLLFDTVDLHYLRFARQARLENSSDLQRLSQEYRKIELEIAHESDATIVVSEIEKRELNKEIPGSNVSIISNIHQPKGKGQPFSRRSGLLFIGNYHHTPNIDAVQWFCDQILPLVLKRLPDVKLTILGSNPTEDIKKLASKNVEVKGYVEDAAPYFEKARIFVSPLRYGAGVKGKIGQAIEYGLPVVTTAIGAEGMHLKHDESCLLADDAKAFAAEIVRLYMDEQLWKKLQSESAEVLEKYFSPQAAKRGLEEVLGG